MINAKSREHAHTCRKARAIFKLRYKEEEDQFSGSVVLTQLPCNIKYLHLSFNQFSGSLDLTRLPPNILQLHPYNNSFSGTVNLSQLPQEFYNLDLSDNELSGEVFISEDLFDIVQAEHTKLIKRHLG